MSVQGSTQFRSATGGPIARPWRSTLIKIGILGAAGIAPSAVIQPARRRNDVVVAAVASRNAGVAGEYAAAHGTPRHLGDYHSSLADQEIELVYVALPQSEHARWSIAAVHPTWG